MGFLSLVIFLEKKKEGKNENKCSQQQGMLLGNLKVQAWEQQPSWLAGAVHSTLQLRVSSRLTGAPAPGLLLMLVCCSLRRDAAAKPKIRSSGQAGHQ